MRVLKLRAPLACSIAKVNRDRLNEAIAREDVPFAPRAERGTPRHWTIPQTVGLFAYGRWIDRGVPPRVAGGIGGKVAEVARIIDGFEEHVGVTFVHAMAGNVEEGLALNVTIDDFIEKPGQKGEKLRAPDELADRFEKKRQLCLEIGWKTGLQVMSPSVLRAPSDVYLQETWRLGPILRHIHHEIEEYRNTLGEEETLG